MSNYEKVYKLAVDGQNKVGKTCIVNQYLQGKFIRNYCPTLGFQVVIRHKKLSNHLYRVHLWDLSGSHREITKNYYKDLDGLLLVYEVNKASSFECLKSILEEFRSVNPSENIMVLGNLKSKNREVTFEEGYKLALEKNTSYLELNAKNTNDCKVAVQQFITSSLLEEVPKKPNSMLQFTNFIGKAVGHNCCLK